jgi:ADP-ribosyl-[dinitrogen reductase] hydrolase
MLGAICGDIIGRPREFGPLVVRSKVFELFVPECRFSDDTVMTAAVADAAMNGRPYQDALVEFGLRHIDGGYARERAGVACR